MRRIGGACAASPPAPDQPGGRRGRSALARAVRHDHGTQGRQPRRPGAPSWQRDASASPGRACAHAAHRPSGDAVGARPYARPPAGRWSSRPLHHRGRLWYVGTGRAAGCHRGVVIPMMPSVRRRAMMRTGNVASRCGRCTPPAASAHKQPMYAMTPHEHARHCLATASAGASLSAAPPRRLPRRAGPWDGRVRARDGARALATPPDATCLARASARGAGDRVAWQPACAQPTAMSAAAAMRRAQRGQGYARRGPAAPCAARRSRARGWVSVASRGWPKMGAVHERGALRITAAQVRFVLA
jgi:hypothetical protein